MRYRHRKVATRGEFRGSLLLAVCVAAAVEAWNKTNNGTWTFLAAASPFVLMLLFILLRWYLRRKALLQSGMDVIDQMSGTEFEQLLLVHFQAQGYTGMLTPTTSDYGADLVLEKAGTRVVVQAKRYRGVVGIEAVQQIIGAVRYYSADRGMVVTNSVFTENAAQLAQVNGIELVDRKQLIAILRKSRGKDLSHQCPQKAEPRSAGEVSSSLPDKPCPRCGKSLVARNGRYGPFIGCSGFPQCRYTRQG